ncbi:MAG: dTDP-4-dehydrorhamnose reductase family protein [Chlorobium sp.]
MRILVFGSSGMLGSTMIRVLNEKKDWQVFGTLRTAAYRRFFSPDIAERLLPGIDVERPDSLVEALIWSRPDVVINCVGLIKQLADLEEPLLSIPINALLPHRLSRLCEVSGARLVHISTDCVFAGDKGGYCESDLSDAHDLYGKSKFLGEVMYSHTVTLRTSMIGHELQSKHGLVDWFLSQQVQCKGFNRAIFSGLPTVVLAKIIRDVVISRPDLSGLYHVAAQPISKYDLLRLIAHVYGKSIEVVADDKLVIDRSLNAQRFQLATGYVPPEWPELIKVMCAYK